MKFVLEQTDGQGYYKISSGKLYKFVVTKKTEGLFFNFNFFSVVVDARNYGKNWGYYIFLKDGKCFVGGSVSIFDSRSYKMYRVEG